MSPGMGKRRPLPGSGASESIPTDTAEITRDSASRLDGALRLPPLEDGRRDPWAVRTGAEAVTADPYAAIAYERMSDRAWHAACERMRNLAESGERRRRNLEHLRRRRPDDFLGRAA